MCAAVGDELRLGGERRLRQAGRSGRQLERRGAAIERRAGLDAARSTPTPARDRARSGKGRRRAEPIDVRGRAGQRSPPSRRSARRARASRAPGCPGPPASPRCPSARHASQSAIVDARLPVAASSEVIRPRPRAASAARNAAAACERSSAVRVTPVAGTWTSGRAGWSRLIRSNRSTISLNQGSCYRPCMQGEKVY